jgi:NTP pyrophosphatase (non-canonical NTP hydrolase)
MLYKQRPMNAIQFNGNGDGLKCLEFIDGKGKYDSDKNIIKLDNGGTVNQGDYILKTLDGCCWENQKNMFENQWEPLEEEKRELVPIGINALQEIIYQRCVDAGWYTDLNTGGPKVVNDGERLMLIVSELAEALEGNRKNLMDDKLPHRKMEEVELADCIIRILDYAGHKGYDIEGAIIEKMEYNLHREDHKIENRRKPFGKKI